MMPKGLLAVLFAALASLSFASAAPTRAGSPHDKIDDPTIGFDDSPSIEQSTTASRSASRDLDDERKGHGKNKGGWARHEVDPEVWQAASESLNSDVIIQNGTDNKGHVRRHHGAGQEATIEQNGTSNSTHINQGGNSLKADVHQTGNDLSVDVHQSGNHRGIEINQFGQGTGETLTVLQY
jgi:hypothetical protein